MDTQLKTTSGYDLIKYGKQLGLNINITDSGSLVNVRGRPKYVIINLDSEGPGTHWIAWHYDKELDRISIFDPFGMPVDPRILRKAKKQAKIARNCRMQVQSLTAESCGYWCLIFLYYMKNYSLPIFFSKLHSSEQQKNEEWLRKQFFDLLK